MARTSLGISLVGCIVVVGLGGHLATGGDNPDQRQRNLLAVNVALDQGQSRLQRGDFAGAVAVLELHIAHIDGNRVYLAALRDAYSGYLGQLEQAGKQEEARRIRGFLEILAPVQVARPERRPEFRPEAATSRAKVEQDTSDPFSESNRAGERPATLVAQAQKAFEAKNYDEAARLYAHAEHLEAGSTAAFKERWGYCRLHGIAQRINRGDPGDPFESEIRTAMSLSSRLEGFGQALLGKLRQPGTAMAVAVKHTGRSGSWNVAESANFRIFHTSTEQTAEKVAQIAETARASMTRKWFNEEPAAWSDRCIIYLHASGDGYARETGAKATDPGHARIWMENGRVIRRRLDLPVDHSDLWTATVPRETTHVLLAGQFGTHFVPIWADEGMAVLSEPRERVELYLKNLLAHRRDGKLYDCAQLAKLTDYPEVGRVSAFYSQSVSLVEFLCKKKDPVTFTRFVRLGLTSGYETALERYYGYHSFAEMEKDWAAYAFGSTGVASANGK